MDYGEDHYTCFQFAYDWRRSSAENAVLLGKFIEEKKAYVEAENRKRFGKSAEVKFNIVAHSMGGLVTRYYLRYGKQGMPIDGSAPQLNWAGAEHVHRAILVGTPNAGSILAMHQLTAGLKLAPLTPEVQKALIGTMHSVYELLPRERRGALLDWDTRSKLSPYDLARWKQHEWGLLDPEQDKILQWLLPEVEGEEERRSIVAEHLSKCLKNAERFHQALDVPASPPEGLSLSLYAGDAEQTPAVALADHRKVGIIEHRAGDGTVTRASALADERVAKGEERLPVESPIDWDRVTFLFRDHLGLTKDPTFADNVLFELLRQE